MILALALGGGRLSTSMRQAILTGLHVMVTREVPLAHKAWYNALVRAWRISACGS